jgi:hypothetical protein
MTQAFNLSQLANGANTSGQLNASNYLYNQVPVANGGTALSSAGATGNMLIASSASAYSTVKMPTFSYRNRIINGDMRIDQRNAGASVSTASNSSAYTLDRWIIEYSQFSKFTLQQNAGSVTPPTGYTNYLGVTSSSAYSVSFGDYFLLEQRVEGFNSADLAWGTASAASITVSFWVRSSLTGTFGGAIRNQAGTRSYPFSFTISAANTWEQKTVTIPGDTTGTWLTTNGIGLRLGLSLGMGSTYTATGGAWAAGNFLTPTGATSVVGTNGATFYITGVQLEAGSVATAFDVRDYGRELMMCQRYYEKSFSQSTAPNNNGTGLGQIAFAVAWGGSLGGKTTIRFAVVKRATPTLTRYGDASGSYGYLTSGILPTTQTTYTYNVNLLPQPSTDAEFNLDNQATQTTLFCVLGGWAASSEL